MGWVPEDVVANLRHVGVDHALGAVVLVLVSGIRIVDRPGRIEIAGLIDAAGVAEVVEAVRRRGWANVTVEGNVHFRVAAAKALLALEPPVRVDRSPLSGYEEAEIEDARLARAAHASPARLRWSGCPESGEGRRTQVPKSRCGLGSPAANGIP